MMLKWSSWWNRSSVKRDKEQESMGKQHNKSLSCGTNHYLKKKSYLFSDSTCCIAALFNRDSINYYLFFYIFRAYKFDLYWSIEIKLNLNTYLHVLTSFLLCGHQQKLVLQDQKMCFCEGAIKLTFNVLVALL
jgi:hypothetical protein